MTAYHDENDCYVCRLCGNCFDNPTESEECCYLDKLEGICPEEEKKE